jgi:winged helix DNA-binding protein
VVTAPTIDLIRRRLANQRLTRSSLRKPADVVAWLGAVQAQDYAGARWALGQRAPGLTDAAVEAAFDEGAILRTHFMRPTWHFVTPADIRWMVALTAPRVHAVSAFYYRKSGLDRDVFKRSRRALEGALQGGKHLTRDELASVLRRARIPSDGLRRSYLMMQAELDQVICSGARRGKQFTYALFDERVPTARVLKRDEALAELTRRYFTSHGPATVRDFVWWSGLTVRDAKAGLDMLGPTLVRKVVGELTYWFAPSRSVARPASPSAHLLPNYDEYLIAYKDRGQAVPASGSEAARANLSIPHHLIVDGRLTGGWKRTLDAGSLRVEVHAYRRLTPAESRALAAAASRYEAFMNMKVTLSIS